MTASVSFVPRTETLALWSGKNSGDPPPLKMPQIKAPFSSSILDQIDLTLGIKQEVLDRFSKGGRGVCVRFIAAWKWLIRTRPELASFSIVALIDVGGAQSELTILHEGFPLFCGSIPQASGESVSAEIEKARAYLCRRYGREFGPVSETVYAPAGAAARAVEMGHIEDVYWHLKPAAATSRMRRVWKEQRNNFWTFVAAACVIAALMFQRELASDRLRFAQLQRDRIQNIARAEAGRSVVVADLLRESIDDLPSSAHFVSFRYDAAAKSVSIEGRADEYGNVSEFSSKLAGRKSFRDARSERTRLESADGRSVVGFSIKGALR